MWWWKEVLLQVKCNCKIVVHDLCCFHCFYEYTSALLLAMPNTLLCTIFVCIMHTCSVRMCIKRIDKCLCRCYYVGIMTKVFEGTFKFQNISSFKHYWPPPLCLLRWVTWIKHFKDIEIINSFLLCNVIVAWYMSLSCVCLSVCMSITLQYYTKTAICRITQIKSHDSPVTIVFWCRRLRRNSNGIISCGDAKRRWCRLNLATFDE